MPRRGDSALRRRQDRRPGPDGGGGNEDDGGGSAPGRGWDWLTWTGWRRSGKERRGGVLLRRLHELRLDGVQDDGGGSSFQLGLG